MFRINVNVHGPVFDGRAKAAVGAFLDEAEWDVGRQGYSNVMTNLEMSIRHPTPYYQTQIITERARGGVVVHDRGIIYGPWLEGVGSRNSPVTRFPGYFSFRRAVARLRTQTKGIAERTLQPYLRRMQ